MATLRSVRRFVIDAVTHASSSHEQQSTQELLWKLSLCISICNILFIVLQVRERLRVQLERAAALEDELALANEQVREGDKCCPILVYQIH